MTDAPDFEAAHRDILQTYDQRTDAWHPWELGSDLRQLWVKLRNAGGTPSIELEADLAAFEFQVDSDEETHAATLGPSMTYATPDGATHERPDVGALSSAHLAVWKARSADLTSALLRARFADAAWSFSKRIAGAKPDPKSAELAVESALEWILKAGLDVFDARDLLARALTIASQIKNKELRSRLREVTLRLDAAEPIGGFFGVAYDLLIAPRRIEPTDPACTAVIAKLESELALYAPEGATRTNPFQAENAAARLIRFYARTDQEPERRRTLARIANAFLVEGAASPGIRATSLASRAEKLLREGGMPAEARAAALKVREFSRRIPAELSVIEHREEIPKEVVEGILEPLGRLDLATCCAITVAKFTPSRAETEDLIARLQNVAPLTFLMGHDVVDAQGRPIAHVGGIQEDTEGHVIHQTSQRIQIDAFLVALSIRRIAGRKGFTVDELVALLKECPLVEDGREHFLRRGIESHLASNYLESVHVLLPQIEYLLRRLVEECGGGVLRPNRSGGYDLRVLDDLLRDPIVRAVLGEDAQTYLRTLLSDQRGWNLRNVVLHGLTLPDLFQETVSARVVHAVLLLLLVRRRAREGGA